MITSPFLRPALAAGDPSATKPITTSSPSAFDSSACTPRNGPGNRSNDLPALRSSSTARMRSARATKPTPEFGARFHRISCCSGKILPITVSGSIGAVAMPSRLPAASTTGPPELP